MALIGRGASIRCACAHSCSCTLILFRTCYAIVAGCVNGIFGIGTFITIALRICMTGIGRIAAIIFVNAFYASCGIP